MTSDTIRQRMQELAAQRRTLKQEQLEASKEGFKVMSEELFGWYPTLKSFSWTQYTTYFNDGDTCTFGARKDDLGGHGVNITFKAEGEDAADDDEDFDEPNWYSETSYQVVGTEKVPDRWSPGGTREQNKYERRPNPQYDPVKAGIADKVLEFLQAFSDEDLEEMFGDHKRITVTRRGVSVDDFTDHD